MILNDNSTQQINTLVIQLQNKITNLNNEFRKLNNNIDDLNSEISDLEKRVSSNENDADNNIGDLDSKISDLEKRVSSNENEAAAMNTEILANTEAISGKADKIHTHTKSQITDFPTSLKNPNALTINGKTYDGSTAVDAGVQTVANGGTGVTTQADINKAFIGNLEVGVSDVTDGTEFVSSFASDNGFSEPGYVSTPLKRKFSTVWNYIKGKISSVLGLTASNYSGKASTAGTADVLANGSGKLKFFYTYTGNSKRLLKLGTFSNGTVASFLLTVKRTDGLGFTGYLTINSNSIYSTNIKQFNGYKSSYSLYEITNGELAFLYRNDNNTNDVYIWCPSYGVVSIILMCGENPWAGGNDADVTLTEVSGFSGTLLDKF